MNENIFYIDAKTKIVDFLTTEFSGTFPLKLQNRFLNFFPQIANYEEEGEKYKPAIFFTNNIDAVVRSIPNATKIVLFNDHNENMFASRLKSLIPFCNLYWCIYISISEEGIEYGIMGGGHAVDEKKGSDSSSGSNSNYNTSDSSSDD